MSLYFGHKEPITDLFDIETQVLIKNKAPLIRSQILIQRANEKRVIVQRMLVDEMNKLMEKEREAHASRVT